MTRVTLCAEEEKSCIDKRDTQGWTASVLIELYSRTVYLLHIKVSFEGSPGKKKKIDRYIGSQDERQA